MISSHFCNSGFKLLGYGGASVDLIYIFFEIAMVPSVRIKDNVVLFFRQVHRNDECSNQNFKYFNPMFVLIF
jgi:hypothetical protein